MRRDLLHALAVFALLLMLGGHITDPFGWDHTFQTGREIDYVVVIVAGCLGTVFLAAALVSLCRRLASLDQEKPILARLPASLFVPPAPGPSASPPALRI